MNYLASGASGATGLGASAFSTLVGVLVLVYVVRLWKGGRTEGRGQFLWGIAAGALLGLGGGILGTIGATAGWFAATGGGLVAGAGGGVAGAHAVTAPHLAPSGTEKGSLGTFVSGMAIVVWNAAGWASDRADGKGWFFGGAFTGVCLGLAGGMLATIFGVVTVTGDSVGQIIIGLTS